MHLWAASTFNFHLVVNIWVHAAVQFNQASQLPLLSQGLSHGQFYYSFTWLALGRRAGKQLGLQHLSKSHSNPTLPIDMSWCSSMLQYRRNVLPGGEWTCFLISLQPEDVVSHPWHSSQLSHGDQKCMTNHGPTLLEWEAELLNPFQRRLKNIHGSWDKFASYYSAQL